MPRKQIPIVATDPYHITARCINRQWFDLPISSVWSIMENYLYLLCASYNLKIHAFVLMSNHFHLLLTAPEGNLSSALLYFMRETSKQITFMSGRINQTYGNRNHKTRINSYHHFLNTYKYVYQNPVQSGLCNKVQDYPYSTLNGILGGSQLVIPICENILFADDFQNSELEWLNKNPSKEHWQQMKAALRRSTFELKVCKRTRLRSPLENELL
jgi:putative transposase